MSSEWVQYYAPELFDDISIERVSEEELEEIKRSLLRPFYLKDKPLSKFRLFQTEKGLYFFWDTNHLFSDGGSIQVLLADIIDIYLHGREANSLAFDTYYLMLEKRTNIKTTGRYAKDRDYFEQRYGGVDWSRRPATEVKGRGRGYGEVQRTMEVSLEQLEALQAESKTSMTGLCLAAQLLALASYNNRSEVLNTWVYNGRDDAGDEDVVGLLFRELPVGVKVVAQTRLNDHLLDVMDQIYEGIAHSAYPWVSLTSDPLSADSTSFNYQNLIGTERDLPIALESQELPEDEYPSPGALEIDLENDGDTRLFTAVFSPDRFMKEDVERFLDMMMDMIGAFVANRNNLDISLEALFEQCSFEFPTT